VDEVGRYPNFARLFFLTHNGREKFRMVIPTARVLAAGTFHLLGAFRLQLVPSAPTFRSVSRTPPEHIAFARRSSAQYFRTQMARFRFAALALTQLLVPLSCGERFVADPGPMGEGGEDSLGTGGTSNATGGRKASGGSGSGGSRASGGAESGGGGMPSGGSDAGGGPASGGDGTSSGGEDSTSSGGNGTGGDDTWSPPKEVLDTFDAATLSDQWAPNPNYYVENERLTCSSGCVAPLVSNDSLHAPLEASINLSEFPSDAAEANLVLFSQAGDSCDQLEISFSPLLGTIALFGCWDGYWQDFGSLPASGQAGSRLDVIITEFPQVRIFLDGAFVGEISIDGYPFDEGKVGVSADGGGTFRFDTFHVLET
jgi:hypothetical protein